MVFLLIAGQNGASSLKGGDIVIEGSRSARAVELEGKNFGESQSLAVLIKGSPKAVDRYGPRAARRLDRLPGVSVFSPWSPNAPDLLRPKRSRALLMIQIQRPYDVVGKETVPAVRGSLRELLPESMTSHVTGSAALMEEMNRLSIKIVKEAERIAAPILLIVLLMVFRTPAAALVPALLGFVVIASGGGLVALLSRVISLDATAVSMMSMMGLALGVDYSLLVVSRFREELADGNTKVKALEITARTAGRTVIFAGGVLITAMVTLLLVAPGDLMLAPAVGVVGAAVLAMAGSTTLLPALLSMLAPHLDRWRIGRKSPKRRVGHIIKRLIRRPGIATAAVLIPLLVLSAPAFGLEIGAFAVTDLPEDNPVRKDYEEIKSEVGGGWASVFTVIAVADQGPMTKRERLSRLDRFQRRVLEQKGVGSVVGPAALNKRSREIQRAARDLQSSRERMSKLERGLNEAGSGVGELRDGLAGAGEGASEIAGSPESSPGAAGLEQGLSQALGGMGELESALSASAAGSERLSEAIADASKGAERITRATGKVEGGSALIADATSDFTSELSGSRESLEKLGSASASAERELELTLEALDGMSMAAKSEPQFASAYERAATALATLSGKHPKSGQYLEGGYYGLSSALNRATEQNIAASKEASKVADGASKVNKGLTELKRGGSDLSAGLGRIHTGSTSLESGLKQTHEGAGELKGGGEALLGGAGELRKGAERLASGLRDGYTQSSGLEYGLERMGSDVGRYRSRQPRGSDAESQSKTMMSGYFMLAGIDGADRDEKESAAFALNWERGGSSSRIFVVPRMNRPGEVDAGPGVVRDLALLNTRLNRMAPKLADELNANVAVGGRGAVDTEFIDTMRGRFIPLLLTLTLVALAVLTVIFRSPLLAVKAVVLNLLTVAAALGVLVMVSSGDSPIIGGAGYLDPVTLFAILGIVFALSIDYEVFMITRMREGYQLTGTTEGAIGHGIDHTARVITGAAAIMIGVFFAFSLSGYASIRQTGVGLGVAVLLDATVIRLILLPATMRLFGRANWWMPRWLDRLLPEVSG